MPTSNPRLTITLQPSLAAQLRRLSELTGNSQSALISELLDGSAPVFDKLITVLEAAHLAKDSIKGSIATDMKAAHEKLETQLGLALETFDEGSQSLLDAAEAIQRRRRGVSRKGRATAPPAHAGLVTRGVATEHSAAVPTPVSNRGVRLTHSTTKTIARDPEGKPLTKAQAGKSRGVKS